MLCDYLNCVVNRQGTINILLDQMRNGSRLNRQGTINILLDQMRNASSFMIFKI